MAERHAAVLTELAELGLALARKLQDRAMAAETAEEERAASLTFHRISRSVRQTLALEAQLERLRRRMLREDIEQAQKTTAQQVERRKAQIRPVVERLVWREHDGEVAEALIEHAGNLLDEDALEDDFLTTSVDDHIARLRDDLGLKPDAPENSAHPREGGDPSGASTPHAHANPGSAWIPACAGTSGEGDGASASDDPLLSDDYWRSSA